MTWLLAVILALAPAYLIRFRIINLPTTLLEVLIVAFLLSVVAKFNWKDLNKLKNLGAINWAIALFVLSAIISTIISPDKARAIGQLKAFIIEPVLLFYAVIILIKKKEQLDIVVRALFWSAVVISAFGIFQHYSFIFLPIRFWGNGTELTRIVSIFEYPNALSLYLAPLLGFFSALWATDYPLTKNRWVSGVAILIMGLALVFTFSRGAWIAATIGILFVLFRRFEFKKVVLPLLITAVLLLFLPGVRERLSLGVSDASSSAHYELLKIGTTKVMQSPIFGNGLYGFRTTQTEVGYSNEILNYPHNFILNFWLELGILGLISFIWLIYLAFKQSYKNTYVFSLAIIAYLLILLIHGLVDVPYFKNDLAVLFWSMLSLLYVKFH